MNELMKKPRQTESLAIGVFVAAVLYTVYRGTPHTVLVGIGFTLILLGALPKQVALAFLVGASAILLVQSRGTTEGFSSDTEEGNSAEPTIVEDPDAATKSKEEKEEEEAKTAVTNGTNDLIREKQESFTNGKKKKVVLPDHTDRKEPLVLGKPYKLPNENDDKGYHMDSGTTFLNAYKALKPDQIAAMTKDTQELLATQKSLIGMLDSFGPLMKDMSKITGFLGPAGGTQ